MVFCIICIPRIRTRKRVVRAQPGYVYETRRQPCQAPCAPRNNQQPQYPGPPRNIQHPPPGPVTYSSQPSANTAQATSVPQKNLSANQYPTEPPPPYTRL
jgi:hypothetical protein